MPDRESRTKRVRFHFVLGGDLDCVVLDEDERTRDAETLFELLQPTIADPLLETLRQTLSLTYSSDRRRPDEESIREIRALAVRTLGELGNELESLRLARVDADSSYEHDHGAQVFKFVLVATKELRRRVTLEETGKRVNLRDVFDTTPADDALRTLRQILSLTFREATTPTQHAQTLEDIRFAAAEALVPCNDLLESIELEPVAMPTVRRFVDGVDTWDDEDDEAESGAAE